jgi:aminomethyltransferase
MSNELKRTALHGTHLKLGAQMTPFGGWDMPVRYSGDIAEHKSVRARAGIFDVSHMGRFAVRGQNAQAFLDSVFTNHVAALKIGQAHYGFLCNTSGGVVDDVICYRRGENFYWLVVNAGNRDKDWQWLVSHQRGDANLQNVSDEWALMALQGPQVLSILANFTDLDFNTIPYYHCADATVAGHEAFIGRTGYTGEDGVELAVRSEHAVEVWTKLLDAGVTPCGLGARDTLRLEAGMALYGHELTDTTNPLAANLKRFIKIDKGDFIGRNRLEQSLKDGLKQKLVGLVILERGIARAGYTVQANGQAIGTLTSGGPSITTGQNIALAYVPVEHSKIDTQLDVLIRDKPVKAKVVKTPFYARKK